MAEFTLHIALPVTLVARHFETFLRQDAADVDAAPVVVPGVDIDLGTRTARVTRRSSREFAVTTTTSTPTGDLRGEQEFVYRLMAEPGGTAIAVDQILNGVPMRPYTPELHAFHRSALQEMELSIAQFVRAADANEVSRPDL